MVDTPTTRNLLRKQSLGSNLNTWGDTYLNDVLDTIDKGLSGVQSIALTGNKTLSSANYATGNEITNQVIKFTGTLSSAVTVTVPSVENAWTIINAAGADVTVKTASGTGVTIPNGRQLSIACDGADVFNASPTNLPGFTPSVAKDIAPKDYVDQAEADARAYTDTAIATASIPGANGTVRVDAAATPGYLGAVLTAGPGVALNDNGNTLEVEVTLSPQSPFWESQSFVDSGDSPHSASSGERVLVDLSSGAVTVTLPSGPANGAHVFTADVTGDAETNALTVARNGSTIDGLSEDFVIDVNNASVTFEYDATATTWRYV